MVHFYRVQRQDELPRRAATFFLPQRHRFVQAVLPPKPRHWAGQAAWARPQGPTQGTGNEFRPLLPKLLPVTRDPHTDAIRSQATLGPRLTSGSVQVPQSHSRDQTTFCGFPANIWLARPFSCSPRLGVTISPLFSLSTSARLLPSQPLINLDEAGHRTLSDTTPHTVVILRSPGDHLSTSRPQQIKRLGRQVILAQPAVGVLVQACRPVINLHSWRQASVVGQSISTFGVIRPYTYYW